ncbi:hypothetical protein ABPG72_001353 [Tetrahymena utriculariae]
MQISISNFNLKQASNFYNKIIMNKNLSNTSYKSLNENCQHPDEHCKINECMKIKKTNLSDYYILSLQANVIRLKKILKSANNYKQNQSKLYSNKITYYFKYYMSELIILITPKQKPGVINYLLFQSDR